MGTYINFIVILVLFLISAKSSDSAEIIQCGHSQTGYVATNHSNLVCTPEDPDRVSLILISEVKGGDENIFRDISQKCNGEATCNLNSYLKDYMSDNDLNITIRHQCLTADRVYKLSNSDIQTNTPDGFILFVHGVDGKWTLKLSQREVQLVAVNCMMNDSASCLPTDLFNLTWSKGVEKSTLISCAHVEKEGITLTVTINETTEPKVDGDVPLLIYFKGVKNCSESVYPKSSMETMKCAVTETRLPTLTGNNDEGNDPAVRTGDDSHGKGKQNDSNDPSAEDSAQEKVIIAVVASLAVVVIGVCLAVLIVNVVRKRRKRERPLLLKSGKAEDKGHQGPQTDQVILNDNSAFPGQLDEKNGTFTYLPAPDGHLLNTSLTDAIDLDGDTSARSRPTSQHAPNQVSYKKAIERQLSPVSYESAFEGTLEEVVLELARQSQDSDSQDECLSPTDAKKTWEDHYPASSDVQVKNDRESKQELADTMQSVGGGADPSPEAHDGTGSKERNSDSSEESDDNSEPGRDNTDSSVDGRGSNASDSMSSVESGDNDKTMRDTVGEPPANGASGGIDKNKEEPDYDLAVNWSTEVDIHDPEKSSTHSGETSAVTVPSSVEKHEGNDNSGEITTTTPTTTTKLEENTESDYEDINVISPSHVRIGPEGEDTDAQTTDVTPGVTLDATPDVSSSFEMVENDMYQSAGIA